MRRRESVGIKDGVILMRRFSGFNYMITLATSYSKFESFEFLVRHYDEILLIASDLIGIIQKDAKKFLQRGI